MEPRVHLEPPVCSSLLGGAPQLPLGITTSHSEQVTRTSALVTSLPSGGPHGCVRRGVMAAPRGKRRWGLDLHGLQPGTPVPNRS